jgi:hypothetical protein
VVHVTHGKVGTSRITSRIVMYNIANPKFSINWLTRIDYKGGKTEAPE